VTHGNHECNKRFCEKSNLNKVVDHLCNMRLLKDALRNASDKVLYVFNDSETRQITGYTVKATLRVPNFVCVQ